MKILKKPKTQIKQVILAVLTLIAFSLSLYATGQNINCICCDHIRSKSIKLIDDRLASFVMRLWR